MGFRVFPSRPYQPTCPPFGVVHKLDAHQLWLVPQFILFSVASHKHSPSKSTKQQSRISVRVKFLASGALARGVNKTRFGGTAEAGALPKSSRAFVGRSARPGRVRDPSLHNHQRPVPTQPLETVPTQPLETVPTRASSRARRTSVRGQECCYVRKQGGTLRDFQGGVHWSHPKFRFHPKRVRCPGEVSGNSSRAERSLGE